MFESHADRSTRQNKDQLVLRAQSGDREAFSELISRHRPLVQRTAYSILKNRDDAEDVTQDVSLNLLRKLHTFEGDSAFTTWLTRIAINSSLIYLRKARRSRLSYLDDFVDGEVPLTRELSDTAPCPEQQCLSNEARNRVFQGISRLPVKLKKVLSDQVYLELPIAEVARRQGLSVAATKSRTYRARKLLSYKLNRKAPSFLSARQPSVAQSPFNVSGGS
jgi:RNA polymerase sigma-70 factor, ECF subfamily